MSNNNQFPESKQKQYLRRKHLAYLASRKNTLARSLNYLGLPSAEMLDVEMWSSVLDSITAVEREEELIVPMKRKAQDIGVRSNLVVLEMDLLRASNLLALDDYTAHAVIGELSLPQRKSVQRARGIPYDVINLDMYSGFLYPKEREPTEAVVVLSNLIRYQARYKHPFVLILTYQLRDKGAEDYDAFISEALRELAKDSSGTETVDAVREFYTAKRIVNQPPHLRRLRFCVPIYVHKVAHESYQVRSLGAWFYKNFYHTSLLFEPREWQGSLGRLWPPPDEIKELLEAPMTRIEEKDGELVFTDLPAPVIP